MKCSLFSSWSFGEFMLRPSGVSRVEWDRWIDVLDERKEKYVKPAFAREILQLRKLVLERNTRDGK